MAEEVSTRLERAKLDRDARVLENVRLAAGCGASWAMVASVALATAAPQSLAEAVGVLVELSPCLEQVVAETPRPHRALATLEPALRGEPELARMRLELGDHELRGKLLFAELLEKRSFVQVAAFAIAGIELSDRDAALLDHEGVLTQLADVRIWPLAVTRRIAASGGELAEAVVGGLASLCTPLMTVQPVAGFMEFLAETRGELVQGAALGECVARALCSGRRILGIGRPVLGIDERVPPKLRLAERYGRAHGANMQLAKQIDAIVFEQKGLRVNSAGYQGALLADLGFSPRAAAAFCLLYFVVPVLAHAAAAPAETLE